MRNEDISFTIPESKEDCQQIDCSICGKMAHYLMQDETFNCYCPRKSAKFWRNV